MDNQPTLLDLTDIPEVTKKSKRKVTEYYIRVNAGDGYHFIWKTHTNGGAEWEHEYKLVTNGGKKKPLRYKTYSGAKRMAQFYADRAEVAVWNAT